ncbi:MAG TPA: PAS domain S-box protein [Verrucomicrobiae bacterium]|nr:PAS domain S-box protein [Verrucomicrobiae bacterium]
MKKLFAKTEVDPPNNLLAAIVDSTDDAIISKDLNGTITTWNKAAEHIFGYTAKEVVGGPISVLIPPEKGAEEMEILQRIRRGERIEHYETSRMRKDGKRIEVSVTISPLSHEGRIIGASKIARDITEQKRIEREIEEHRARLQVTLSSIGDAVIVTNANAQVDYMNPVAEALTGWKIAEARGQALEAVFNIINETTRRRVENPAARALEQGAIVALANHTVLIAKGGAEYAIDDTAAPIRASDKNVLGAVLVFRDVSSARAKEDFRARLAAIVQSSDDAIISKDLNGRIMSWNPGAVQLFGYNADEAVGRPISMVIPPERLHEETNILERLRRGERIDHFETVRITKDRRKVEVSLTVSPIFDSEGHVVGASKIARNITDRKRIDRELAEARDRLQRHSEELERVVGERTAELEAFTYTVAHDLRAPVRRMQGFVSSLQMALGSGIAEEPRELLRRTAGSLDRMDKLVADLLKLSQVGRQTGQLEEVALDNVVQQAVAELKPQIQDRQIQWMIGSLPVVHGNPDLLRQAFINLLSNALKYTRPRAVARIEVDCMSDGGNRVFYVRDNGVGFDMDEAGKLFTPFHRLHNERQFEGSGVGLAIVERIVGKHGGQIWCDAKLDQGATFFFTLQKDSGLKGGEEA